MVRAKDGEEALEALRKTQRKFKNPLLDINLPKVDGIRVAQNKSRKS